MMNLTSRHLAPTLGALLPYQSTDPEKNVIWLKDGSVVQTLSLIPKNIMSSTEDELQLLRMGLSSVLNQLPENAVVQFLLIREKTNEGSDQGAARYRHVHASNTVEAASAFNARENIFHSKMDQMNEMWKEGQLLQTKIFVSLRMPAPEKPNSFGALGSLSYLAFNRKSPKTKFKSGTQLLGELKTVTEALKLGFDSVGFEVDYTNQKEQLEIIFKFLNPERGQHGIPDQFEEKTKTDFSEAVALTDLIEEKSGLALGRTKIRIGSLKTLPETSSPGLMTAFSTKSESFMLVSTILVLSQVKERERLSRKQRMASGLATGNQVRNLQAETQLHDIEDTLSAMLGSGEKLFASSFHVIAFDDGNSSGAFQNLIDTAERIGSGCQWFEETVGAYPVFFGIMPFAPTFITRPKRILSTQMSDFLPVYGVGPGHVDAAILFETPYQSNLGFSFFEKSPCGNAIVIGSTGSGKSTLACGMILGESAGTKADPPATFVIDVGNSFRRTMLYLGGSTLDLSPESGIIINPFDLEPGATRPDPEKVKFLTAIFDEILADTGNLSKLERALLEGEILEFYRLNSSRTLSRFRDHLEKCKQPELTKLSKLLTLWCKPHPYGLLFDGETNVDLKSNYLHFELRGCQRHPDLLRLCMLVVMDLIWRQLKNRFPLPSRVYIDETRTVIRPSTDGRTNLSARWVEDFFRQIRKFAGAVISLSQNAKDYKTEDIGDGIFANAPNRFILRQRGDEKTLKEDLKLNDKEISDVFGLMQVRGAFSEFFLHSESMKTVLVYRPTPLELWLSTTHPADSKLLEDTQLAHPEWDLPKLMDYLAKNYPQGAEGPSLVQETTEVAS